METQKIQRIALEHLLVDLQNPRYDPRINQREALATIAQEQGAKLINLAEDIVERGLNPSELPMVTPIDDGSSFIVLEGNRRIAALKLILFPLLLNSLGLPKHLVTRFKNLYGTIDANFAREYDCVVLSRDDANHWILLKHTGENEGVGVVTWDGRARQRFRGSSPALQAIEIVEASNLLDEETKKKLSKIAITNVERILNTPDARNLLGLDIQDNQLVLKNADESLGRLAMVVSDVANKKIKVSDIDSKDQRVEYAQQVVAQPLPSIVTTPDGHPKGSSNGTAKSNLVASGSTPKLVTPKRISPDRAVLIPKTCKLHIPQIRINRIYHELQKLKLEEFINSCAVLLRVFVELSLDDYGQRQSISFMLPAKTQANGNVLPPKEFSLRQKMSTVSD